MRIAYMVFNVDGSGGTSRSVITQANALAADHEVQILSVTRSGERPHYDIDPRITTTYCCPGVVEPDDPASRLVPTAWDAQFSARTDTGLAEQLTRLEADVLVTVTPALLALAVQLAPSTTTLVHQEHRSTSDRGSGLEPLLAFAPRADVVALLTGTMADWLGDQLGAVAPEIVVMPNPLPIGFAPRSMLDQPLIVSAGRLVGEKQWHRLVTAFSRVAGTLPAWRLRIFGDGPQRAPLQRQVRRLGLYDRVELPGLAPDMRGEWAKASICALTSRSEGLPLILQEAMAAGVPAVSFDCASGPRALIEHGRTGLLVTPDSNPALAGALLRLAEDVELRQRLGAAARVASRQYDADTIAARWVEIFERAVAAHGSAPPATPPVGRRRPTGGLRRSSGVGTTPAVARSEALAAVTAAARSTGGAWWVMPAHERITPVVVVPGEHRNAFLAALRAPKHLSLVEPAAFGWPERRSSVPEGVTRLGEGMTPWFAIEPWPEAPDGLPSLLGRDCGVEVEFWEPDESGELTLPRRNPYTRRIPRHAETVTVQVLGIEVPTLPLMALPTPSEVRSPVDAVWTWVDGSDTEWDAARERRLAGVAGTSATRGSSGRARFVSRDELRWSMRSVHLFAPWVRHLYVVTADQVPAWLDAEHPDVTIVDHREILPADALPTFNSQAIETGLHRIDGLAEHFLYLNDDFFLGRPLSPSTFFTGAGQPKVFLDDAVVGLTDRPDTPSYLRAAANNRALVQQHYGIAVTATLSHAPYALTRTLLGDLEHELPDAFAATARAPFRSDSDVSVPSSLAGHVGLATGQAVTGDPVRAYVDLGAHDLRRRLGVLRERAQDLFCLGDHPDLSHEPGRVDALVTGFLEDYLPVPAPWEVSPHPAGT